MAVASNEIQIKWAAANSKSVAGSASEISDSFTFNASSFQATIILKADNSGAPASGDTIDYDYLPTSGDPDGSGGDEFATNNHAISLGRIDTNADDPGVMVVTLPVAKGGKLRATNNSAGAAITVSATVREQTA